jgi:hypothetical protein
MERLYSEASIRHVTSGLRQVREYGRQHQFLTEVRRVVRDIAPRLPPLPGMSPPSTWTIERILSTTRDACSARLGTKDGETMAILKLARTAEAMAAMRREIRNLRQLDADRRLEELRPVLPRVLACGEARGCLFLLQQALPGLDARRVLSDSLAVEHMQMAAARNISLLHRHTARTTIISSTLTDRWIDEPMRAVSALGRWYPRIARSSASIESLARGLCEALLGRSLTVSWVHGDFSPGNLRVTVDGLQVTGILDWENSTRNGFPPLDLMQLVLSTRMLHEGRELGHVLRVLLHGGGLSAHERRLLEMSEPGRLADGLGLRELLILSWLRHVSDNLGRSSALNRHRWWVRKNVESVLAQV